MKYAYFLLLLLFSGTALAQSVGVNTTIPSAAAALDIRPSTTSGVGKGVAFPNVALQSATDGGTIISPPPGLMVYNTTATPTTPPPTVPTLSPGLYFNNGTAAAPIWVPFNKQVQNIHAFDTGGRTGVSSSTLMQQPGCTITVIVPTGQTVDVKVDAIVGGATNITGNGAYSTLIAAINYDTGIRPPGGASSIGLNGTDDGFNFTNDVATVSITSWFSLTAGTHTISLLTARGVSNPSNNTLIIGGNPATSSIAGQIHATVYYR